MKFLGGSANRLSRDQSVCGIFLFAQRLYPRPQRQPVPSWSCSFIAAYPDFCAGNVWRADGFDDAGSRRFEASGTDKGGAAGRDSGSEEGVSPAGSPACNATGDEGARGGRQHCAAGGDSSAAGFSFAAGASSIGRHRGDKHRRYGAGAPSAPGANRRFPFRRNCCPERAGFPAQPGCRRNLF
jgi:hypothetical protein